MPKDEKLFLITFLLNQLNDEYNNEFKCKEILESKAIGYYTIFGIILTASITLQIAFMQNEALSNNIKKINSIIFSIIILFYIIFLICNFLSYRTKKINTFSANSNWDNLIDTMKISIEDNNQDDSLDGFITNYRNEIKKIIEQRHKINEALVKLVNTQAFVVVFTGFLLIIELIIFIIQL